MPAPHIVMFLGILFSSIGEIFRSMEVKIGKHKLKTFGLLIFVVGIMIGGLGVYLSSQEEEKYRKKEIENRNKFELDLKSNIVIIENLLRNYGYSQQNIQKTLNNGVEKIDKIGQSISASKELSFYTQGKLINKRNILVNYFPKDVDKEVVERALRETGFDVIEGKTNLPDTPTNAIFYGSKVSLDDIKVVTLILLRAGIELRIIRPFARNIPEREYLIQVGSLLAAENRRALTVDEVIQIESFSDLKEVMKLE